MNEIVFKSPKNKKELEQYDLFRWEMLRKPIGKEVNSLKDEFEQNAFHLVGIIKKRIIACGRLHFKNNYEAQIRYMAVSESYQGMGIGKKLLILLEDNAKQNNAKKIILNARDHAIGFYKASGYTVHEKYYGSDTGIPHTTMTKTI